MVDISYINSFTKLDATVDIVPDDIHIQGSRRLGVVTIYQLQGHYKLNMDWP